MRKFPLLFAALLTAGFALCSCSDDEDSTKSTWERYEDYRNANISWVDQQEARTNADGTKYFSRIIPQWNPNDYILIHWFNDRSTTAGNLQPLYTSSVRCRYVGRNYQGVVFDADSTSASGSLFKISNLIPGWQTALQNMHVGDTVEIVLPYRQAYDSQQANNLLLPYSALRFNLRLLDIPAYEVRP